MMRVCSCLSPLPISSVAPLRRTIATSRAPESVSTALKPALIDSTPMSTMTTPAMPTSATTVEVRRSDTLRRFIEVIAEIWVIALPAMSHLPQCVDDSQPGCLHGRLCRRESAEHDHQHGADHPRDRRHAEHREELRQSLRHAERGELCEDEADGPAKRGDQQSLADHQPGDAGIRVAEGLHHADLVQALADGLAHGIGG